MRHFMQGAPDWAAVTEQLRGSSAPAGPVDAASQLGRFIEDAPDIASINHPTLPLLQALCGQTDQAAQRLEAYVAALPGRVQDSEWLPEVAQAAMVAIMLRHRAAAAQIYPHLAPYGDLFAVEGIGAATWGCVHAFLGGLAHVLGRAADAREHFVTAEQLNSAAGAALAHRTRRWAAETQDAAKGPARMAAPSRSGVFQCQGEVWILEFGGRTVQLKDTKGLRDLAVLLARPGREIAVHELTTSPRRPGSSALDLTDRTAIEAYRRRLIDLECEIDDAEAMHDPARTERAATERDALIEELSTVTGLTGRPRRAGSDTERMRKAVNNRIRLALRRIEQVHPELGRHLRVSIRMGTFCRYEPDLDTHWDVVDTRAGR